MDVSISNRLQAVINDSGMTVNQFASQIGFHQGNLSLILNGKRNADNRNLIKNVSKIFGIREEWLRYGSGDKFTGEGSLLKEMDAAVISHKEACNKHIIMYYPNVDGTMGGVQFLDDPNETAIEMSIPGFAECKFAMNAYGGSMSPLIKSGQIVLLAEWRERFIDWGKIYLVVTRSGYRVIKRLFPGKTESSILCRSENKEANPDFGIEKEDITHIYLVKGWVCRDVT